MFMTTPTRSPLEQVFCLFCSHMGDGGEHMGTVHCCTLYAVAMVDHPISSFLEVATTCTVIPHCITLTTKEYRTELYMYVEEKLYM